jgi:two-component system, NarL family, nitrate/nitrite response regulator NarL
MRLLLCDRHPMFVESLALVLAGAGYEIVGATTSLESTLAALLRRPADVCVVDAGCTGPDPGDRIARLSRAAPGLRLVLLFGHAGVDGLDMAAHPSVHAFAYKDEGLAEIVETIERVGAGQRVGHRDTGRRDPARRVVGTVPRAGELPGGSRLTVREREALGLLMRGVDTHGVAELMGVSRATARSHIRSVFDKLDVHTRVGAAAAAVRRGLVDAETGDWLPEPRSSGTAA